MYVTPMHIVLIQPLSAMTSLLVLLIVRHRLEQEEEIEGEVWARNKEKGKMNARTHDRPWSPRPDRWTVTAPTDPMDAVAAGPAVSCSPSTCRLNCSYRHLGRSGPAGRKQVAGRNQSTVTHRREQRKVSGTSLAPTAASGRILLLPRPTANPVNCACLGSSIGQLHGLRSIHGVFFCLK